MRIHEIITVESRFLVPPETDLILRPFSLYPRRFELRISGTIKPFLLEVPPKFAKLSLAFN